MKQTASRIIVGILLILSSFTFLQLPSAHALGPRIVQQKAQGDNNALLTTFSLTFSNSVSAGDQLIINWQMLDNSGTGAPVSTTDSKSDVYTQNCHSNVIGEYDCISYSTASSAGVITVTVHYGCNGGVLCQVAIEMYEATGYTFVGVVTKSASGTSSTPAVSPTAFGGTPLLIASFAASGSIVFTTPGTGFKALESAFINSWFAESNSTGAVASPTTFPTMGTGDWAEEAIMLSTGVFSCQITNLDAGNNVVAGSVKFYDFECFISSLAITAIANSTFDFAAIIFNDSLISGGIILPYSQFSPTYHYGNSSVNFGEDGNSGKISLGAGTAVTSYSGGYFNTTVNFAVQFNSGIYPAQNRGIELDACVISDNGAGAEYCRDNFVRENYFNIIKNGLISTIAEGTCGVPAGADTFGMSCKYNSTAASNIEENATYVNFQQYQGLFSLQLADYNCHTYCTGGDPALWQTYPFSGSGTNNSTNPGDWDIIVGLYYFDNTNATCCWLRGLNAELSTTLGRVGSNYQFTQYNVEWRNGATFIANQTFQTYTEPAPVGRSTIYVNLWYSQNNGSTVQGGRVASYYTGMVNNAILGGLFSNWSPQSGNDTSAQIFAPLVNSGGYLISATGINFTKVFMIMSRPGPPAVHTKQPNFTILSYNFQLDQFGTTQGSMTGIDTPPFTPAIVPVLQNNNIFQPIIKALQDLAGLVVGAFTFVGQQIYNSLSQRFPWFTSAVTSFSNFIIALLNWEATLIIQIINFLNFAYKLVALIFYPIDVIISSYNYIVLTYGGIFTGVNLSAMIEIVVLYVFVGWVLDRAEAGDGGAFVEAAKLGWRVVDSIARWVWMIAKFFVDSIEGLIP